MKKKNASPFTNKSVDEILSEIRKLEEESKRELELYEKETGKKVVFDYSNRKNEH